MSGWVEQVLDENVIEMLIRWGMRARRRLAALAFHTGEPSIWMTPRFRGRGEQTVQNWFESLRFSRVNWSAAQNQQNYYWPTRSEGSNFSSLVASGGVEAHGMGGWTYRPGFNVNVGGTSHTHWMGRPTGGGSVDSWMEVE